MRRWMVRPAISIAVLAAAAFPEPAPAPAAFAAEPELLSVSVVEVVNPVYRPAIVNRQGEFTWLRVRLVVRLNGAEQMNSVNLRFSVAKRPSSVYGGSIHGGYDVYDNAWTMTDNGDGTVAFEGPIRGSTLQSPGTYVYDDSYYSAEWVDPAWGTTDGSIDGPQTALAPRLRYATRLTAAVARTGTFTQVSGRLRRLVATNYKYQWPGWANQRVRVYHQVNDEQPPVLLGRARTSADGYYSIRTTERRGVFTVHSAQTSWWSKNAASGHIG